MVCYFLQRYAFYFKYASFFVGIWRNRKGIFRSFVYLYNNIYINKQTKQKNHTFPRGCESILFARRKYGVCRAQTIGLQGSNVEHLAVVGQLDVGRQLGVDLGMAPDVVAGMDEPCAAGSDAACKAHGVAERLVRVVFLDA